MHNVHIIPAPRVLDVHSGCYTLSDNATVAGETSVSHILSTFVEDVVTDGGPALCVGRGDGAEIHVRLSPQVPELARLVPADGVSPYGGSPFAEGYVLDVTSGGILLDATHPNGIRYGLTTLRQLIATSDRRPSGEIQIPNVRVVDLPRVAWRGLTVDVARTFFGPDELTRVLHVLALYKLNVLHLHLTDDQGWRLESRLYPELTADSPSGSFLTQEEYQRLAAQASDLGITLIPEIDLPGHSLAAARAVAGLAQGRLPEDGRGFNLDPRRPATLPFARGVLAELAQLTPGPYLHVGGDETLGMSDALYQEFMDQHLPEVRSLGKRIVGWQELARASVRAGDLVQYWVDTGDTDGQPHNYESHQSPEDITSEEDFFRAVLAKAPFDIAFARAKGAQIILSPISIAYFDTGHADAVPDAQRPRIGRLGFPAYTPRTLQEFYEWHPADIVADITRSDIGGVQAAIWGETLTDAIDLELMVLPRLPGFAERAWSPHPTWRDYRARLRHHSHIWRKRGWTFAEVSTVEWR